MPEDGGAAQATPAQAAATEPEVQRTLTVAPPPEPRDPDGDDLFIDLSDEAIPQGTLTNVAGIKFRDAGTVHAYDAGDASYRRGERVIVESERGPIVATIAVGSRRQPSLDPLRRIVRMATANDEKAKEKNSGKEREAYVFCKQKIREKNLPMKLTRVEFPLVSSGKVLFYFASEDRIDFRDLVKDLAQRLHTRIEMRQIGVRDEAKLLADYGDCGKPVCCNTHMTTMPPVSMRMAKVQKSTLDPSKISGRCGRLKCCLRFEQDVYEEFQKELPQVGVRVLTAKGQGRVLAQEILARKVLVEFEDGRRLPVAVDEILTRLGK